MCIISMTHTQRHAANDNVECLICTLSDMAQWSHAAIFFIGIMVSQTRVLLKPLSNILS